MARAALLPVPLAFVALRVTEKLPLWVGVPTICPEPLTDRPLGSPAALKPVMGALVVTIWIAVMALPTVPATGGIVAVTTGTLLGSTVNPRLNGALVPAALVAVRLVV